MDIFEQKEVLKSMVVLCDTREQDTARAKKRYAMIGYPVQKATIDYGDYTYNARLPNGEWIHSTDYKKDTVFPKNSCIIERKMSLDEIEQNFIRGKARFEEEFGKAAKANNRIVVMVENATWENLLNGKYKSKIHPNAFKAFMVGWMIRYNWQVVFCKEETSGRLIGEILYRDLKERLERGEYG